MLWADIVKKGSLTAAANAATAQTGVAKKNVSSSVLQDFVSFCCIGIYLDYLLLTIYLSRKKRRNKHLCKRLIEFIWLFQINMKRKKLVAKLAEETDQRSGHHVESPATIYIGRSRSRINQDTKPQTLVSPIKNYLMNSIVINIWNSIVIKICFYWFLPPVIVILSVVYQHFLVNTITRLDLIRS